jgi:general secretion pathway protein L
MSKSRVIYYTFTDAVTQSAILSENNAVEQVCGDIDLKKLDQLEKQNIVVLLPSQHLTFHQTHIHTNRTTQLQQALPFALEESLAGDITAYKFCLLYNQASTQHTVVMKLDYWQELLTTFASCKTVSLVADIYALPYEGHWSMLISTHRVLIRTGTYSGLCIDRSHLDYFLTDYLPTLEAPPQQMSIYSTVAHSIQVPGLTIHTHIIENEFEFLASGLSDYNKYNCLRDKPKRRLLAHKWRLYASVALSVALFSFISTTLWQHHHLTQLQQRYETDIARVYRQVFPHASQISAPQVRFERELKQRLALTQGEPTLHLLHTIAPYLLAQRKVRLKAIHYHNSELHLSLHSSSLAAITQLKHDLVQHGFQAKLAPVHTEPNNTTAELILVRSQSK